MFRAKAYPGLRFRHYLPECRIVRARLDRVGEGGDVFFVPQVKRMEFSLASRLLRFRL